MTAWYTMWQHATRCNSMLHDVTACYTIWQHGTQCNSMLQNVTACYTMWQHSTQCDSMLHNVTGRRPWYIGPCWITPVLYFWQTESETKLNPLSHSNNNKCVLRHIVLRHVVVSKTRWSAAQSETGICHRFQLRQLCSIEHQGQGRLTLKGMPSRQASKGITNRTLKMMDYEI